MYLIGLNFGGRGGIRTLDTLSRIHTFQACALSHSATLPQAAGHILSRRTGLPPEFGAHYSQSAPRFKRLLRVARRRSHPEPGLRRFYLVREPGPQYPAKNCADYLRTLRRDNNLLHPDRLVIDLPSHELHFGEYWNN
jgi:hypothetical protein